MFNSSTESSINDESPRDHGETLFTRQMVPFDYEKGSKIMTSKFLLASRSVLTLIDRLGKVFAPVRYDMQGNITKLTEYYERDPDKFCYIEDMIMHERNEGDNKATEALQWLRRGLHFMQKFMESIVADHERNKCLSYFMKMAYAETLERYHGWMGSQLFNIMCRFSPTRKEFFSILAMDQNLKADVILRDMSNFLVNLSNCVQQLTEFYTVNNLETHNRV